MSKFPRSYGVNYTVIKNLTGERKFLAWFPTEKGGDGRWIEAHEKIKVSGNFFEAFNAQPLRKSRMDADITDGIVAVAACADPEIEYSQIVTQPVTLGCIDWVYESSSSAWVEG